MLKDKLKEIRVFFELTAEEMGEELECSSGRIFQYENGGTQPSEPLLALLCHRFHIDREWLMDESVSDKPLVFTDHENLPDFSASAVAERIQNLMQERNMNLRQFASFTGCSASSLSRTLNQKTVMSRKAMELVAEACGVGVYWLRSGNLKYKEYPCDQRMIEYLWEHPEAREYVWKMIVADN